MHASNIHPRREIRGFVHIGECSTANKTVSRPIKVGWVAASVLSLLLNEFETSQSLINRQFSRSLAFLPDNLLDFACDLLRLLSIRGLRLVRLLLFWLGLQLGICMLPAFWV
jgi:hypothetical protein